MTVTMWISVALIIVSFYLIVKKFEPRLILLAAGIIMTLLSGKFLPAIDTISSQLAGYIPQVIAAACAYAYLMNYTKCDVQLATWLMGGVKKMKAIIIPATVVVGAVICYAINSPAGFAAAVGPVIIPVMVGAGVHPVMAGATLLFCSYGNVLAFGSQVALIAEGAGITPPEVIPSMLIPTIVTLIGGSIILVIMAKMKKEDSGYVDVNGDFAEQTGSDSEEKIKINILHALMPFLPVILIFGCMGLASVTEVIPALDIRQAMYISCIIAVILTRCNPGQAIKEAFKGVGYGYAEVSSLIVCAGVFTFGMQEVGLIDALIAYMSSASYIAAIAAAIGPFAIAFVSGSGDAPTLAFNTAITPYVADMGLSPLSIGILADLAGCFGRSMSPVAGVTILCASFSKQSPMDLIKLTAVPCIVGLIFCYVWYGLLFVH